MILLKPARFAAPRQACQTVLSEIVVIDAEMANAAGEYIGFRSLPTIVLAQRFEEFRAHRDIAITRAFALPDVDDHAIAVNVAYFEQRTLGPAQERKSTRLNSSH
jgi:hypothetical protein